MPLISFQVRTKCIDITSSDKLWYSPVDHSIPSPYSAGPSLSSHQWFFYFCSVLWGFIRVIHSRMQILVNEEEKERDRRKIRPGKCQFPREMRNLISARAVEYRPAARNELTSWKDIGGKRFLSLSFSRFFFLSLILLKYFLYIFINKDRIRYTQYI